MGLELQPPCAGKSVIPSLVPEPDQGEPLSSLHVPCTSAGNPHSDLRPQEPPILLVNSAHFTWPCEVVLSLWLIVIASLSPL